jgi:hypothetical protein
MFAPRISEDRIKASRRPSRTRVRQNPLWLARQTSHDAIRDDSEERASVPTVSWSFGLIPVFPPVRTTTPAANDGNTGTRSIVTQQEYALSATLRAAGQGRQNDAMSAGKPNLWAGSEVRVTKPAVPHPRELKPGRKEGETVLIPIPDGLLTPISGEQADAFISNLKYVSSITQQGAPPPADFGVTNYKFVPENFLLARPEGGYPGHSGHPEYPRPRGHSGYTGGPSGLYIQFGYQGYDNVSSGWSWPHQHRVRCRSFHYASQLRGSSRGSDPCIHCREPGRRIVDEESAPACRWRGALGRRSRRVRSDTRHLGVQLCCASENVGHLAKGIAHPA